MLKLKPGVKPRFDSTMADHPSNSRRHFLRLCGSAWAALACGARPLSATPRSPQTRFQKTLIVDQDGAPIRCEALGTEREHVFHYPFKSTPCFLIDLGESLAGVAGLHTDDGRTSDWQGGVGPNRSVVAFSAICAHQLSHPSKIVSFIGYRSQPVGYVNKNHQIERRSKVIQCCSEHSIYDPTQGAAVVSGPAPQPLAAIELTHEDDMLYASGVYGGDQFDRYFGQFGERLQFEYLGDSYRELMVGETTAVPGELYTRNRIKCS